MASVSEELSDVGPVSPKRIKLDDTPSQTKSNAESCLRPFSIPEDQIDDSDDCLNSYFTMLDKPAGFEADGQSRQETHSDLDEGEEDEVSSTVSNVSDLSGLSEMSGLQWKPLANILGTIGWIEKQMAKGVSPRVILSQITGEEIPYSDVLSDLSLWKIIFSVVNEFPRRNRLASVTTLEDVVRLLRTSRKIIVLTGAGVSVSCGIPDFRSKDGVYARLAVDFPDLPNPQAMFDINYFCMDPRPFFKFAREIYPGQFRPSPCHRFIKMLEKQKKLLRNYTQNIDTLERVAGIENVMECHGSFSTATCTQCGHKVTSEDIREEIFNQQIPYCRICPTKTNEEQQSSKERGVMKPDIVFFGEGLPESFHESMGKDRDDCDLLIVIGSSLKVKPVALIPCSLPQHVPQILINRERLPHMKFDVELLGDSDIIIDQLCHMLGGEWENIRWREAPLENAGFIPDSSYFGTDSSYSSSDDRDKESVGDIGEVKCQRIARRVATSSDSISGSVMEESNSRHVSLDSSRDSGIGEGSNSSSEPISSPISQLPENSYFQLSKRRYAFPGAEVL